MLQYQKKGRVTVAFSYIRRKEISLSCGRERQEQEKQ